jgi:hypothetical protein
MLSEIAQPDLNRRRQRLSPKHSQAKIGPSRRTRLELRLPPKLDKLAGFKYSGELLRGEPGSLLAIMDVELVPATIVAEDHSLDPHGAAIACPVERQAEKFLKSPYLRQVLRVSVAKPRGQGRDQQEANEGKSELTVPT